MKTVRVPWADPSSRYTHDFEAYGIGWAKEASILAVSRQLGIGWKAIDGIIRRAVERGLLRRIDGVVENICVDEVSYKKRHKYLTIVSDADTGTVLYVGIGRDKAALTRWIEQLSPAQLQGIRSVSMDMWPAYIRAVEESLPNAAEKICFDRFHVAKCLGEAVDKVRRQEHKELRKEANQMLTGSKYTWLKSPPNMSSEAETCVSRPAHHYPEYRPGLGYKGNGQESMVLCASRLGTQGLETMAELGHALSTRTRQRGRQNHQESLVGHP